MPGKSVGEQVNIEVDVLGKYVERLLQHGIAGVAAAASTITPEFLKENGYD